MDSLAEMFGGADKIPSDVKDAMKLSDYGKGKPLTARRIIAVKNAIDSLIEAERQAEAKMNDCIAEGKVEIRGKCPFFYEYCDVDKLIETAFSSCGGNTDAMDIVKSNLCSFIADPGNKPRSEEYVRNRAEGLAANLNELKALSAKIPGIYESGRKMLSNVGKPIPQDILSKMIGAANEAPIGNIRKLSGYSSPMDIHKAIMEAFKTVYDIMNSSGADRKLVGSDETKPARQFVLDVMLSRCGRGALGKIKDALTSGASAQMLAYYTKVEQMSRSYFPGESEAVNASISDLCSLAMATIFDMVDSVYAHISRLNPGAQPIELPAHGFHPDLEAIDGDRIMADTVSMAKDLLSGMLEKHIDKLVTGSGNGADTFKAILRQKLAGVYNPDTHLADRMKANANAMMNWNICGEMKKIVTGKQSQFEADINRGINATLSDGKTIFKLTQNFEVARDELAQFVTGDPKTTYASLAKATDKSKVHLLMALISQETGKAPEMGVKNALDPRESLQAFGTCFGKPQSRSFTIEKLKDGGIGLHYVMDNPLKAIDDCFSDNDDDIDVGKGSRFKCQLDYTLYGSEFNRLAELDFSKFNDDEGQIVFSKPIDMPDGTRQFCDHRLEKTVDTFAQEFKVEANRSSVAFWMTLNPSEEELGIQDANGPENGNIVINS